MSARLDNLTDRYKDLHRLIDGWRGEVVSWWSQGAVGVGVADGATVTVTDGMR
jgi:hypothetical protein